MTEQPPECLQLPPTNAQIYTHLPKTDFQLRLELPPCSPVRRGVFLLPTILPPFSHPPPSNGLAPLGPSNPPPPNLPPIRKSTLPPNSRLVFPFQVPRRFTHRSTFAPPIVPSPSSTYKCKQPDPRPDLNKTSSSPHNLQIPKHIPLLNTTYTHTHSTSHSHQSST